MANLSGQTIQSTYPGLLNLNTATTGITSTPQAITDGLGNNTGTRIATNYLTAPNVVGQYTYNLKPQYQGLGIGGANGTLLPNITQNNLLWTYFYDSGSLSYSAITVGVVTPTSTSDTCELLIYDLQFVDEYGMYPNNMIASGITVDVTTTGSKTYTFPTPISFSGNGGGWYAIIFKVTNPTLVTPTCRFTNQLTSTVNHSYGFALGIVRNNSGTAFFYGNRAGNYQGAQWYFINNQTTPSIITAADVVSRFNSTTTTLIAGFNLHTVK